MEDLLGRLNCWLINTYEKYTHWYWNKKPHHVTCKICKDALRSDRDKYSPEECGWRPLANGHGWICHMCDAHRDYTPYVKLTDIDEEIAWSKITHRPSNEMIKKRELLIEKLK